MTDGAILVAYHGCDATVRDALVKGELKGLDRSDNPYDWLGAGIYFFENDPIRAWRFAEASYLNEAKKYTAQPIATPAVVGAVLRVSRWLDLTNQVGHQIYRDAFVDVEQAYALQGRKPPKNTRAGRDDDEIILRRLDRTVINMAHSQRDKMSKLDPSIQKIQAVRGAFYQGNSLAPTSEFKDGTHIQIAVREADCILGWFLLPGDTAMTADEAKRAHAALAIAKAGREASKDR